MVREVMSTGRCCAIAWMVLVLKEAKCFHSSPSGECPHSAFRFIIYFNRGNWEAREQGKSICRDRGHEQFSHNHTSVTV